MAFADNLPINETLGVFIGVAGIDWLADGHAEPIKALVIAVAVGVVIMVARKLLKHRAKD